MQQLTFIESVQKFVQQHEKWCCLFPSLNANANIKNFRHLLLDLPHRGRCLAPAPMAEVSPCRGERERRTGEHLTLLPTPVSRERSSLMRCIHRDNKVTIILCVAFQQVLYLEIF